MHLPLGGVALVFLVGLVLLTIAFRSLFNSRVAAERTQRQAEVDALRAELDRVAEKADGAVRTAQEATTRDELTGAHTKAYFLRTMGEMIDVNRPFVVAFAGIDNPLDTRSRFGKPVLHELLRRIAISARTAFRDCDVVAHFSDGTFAVLIVDAPLEIAMMRADQFRQLVETIIVREHPDLQPTICVGVSEHLRQHRVEDVMIRGERALEAAKLAGRNRVMFWQEADVES